MPAPKQSSASIPTPAHPAHNGARRVFINAVVRKLARQGARDLNGRRIRPYGDEEDLRAELTAAPAILSVLDVLWPEYTPQQLLTQLYQNPRRLDLTEDERAAIARDTPGPWTPADVPLLDELADLLGPLAATEIAARRRRAAAEAERAEEVQYAAELVAQLAADEAIVLPPLETDTFVTWIAGRNTESAPGGMLAERALHDRNWAYGHVIVDEAQEVSAMAWRMVLRHCPARSMTVVGDLAQTGTPGGADSWAQVLDPVAVGRWRTERLTVNYRTPAPVMALAAALLPPSAEPPLSVRDSDESPWCAGADDLADRVRRETELIGAGRVAVIAPPDRVAETAVVLGLTPGPDLDAPVAVLTPEQAKGLEFELGHHRRPGRDRAGIPPRTGGPVRRTHPDHPQARTHQSRRNAPRPQGRHGPHFAAGGVIYVNEYRPQSLTEADANRVPSPRRIVDDTAASPGCAGRSSVVMPMASFMAAS